LYNFHSYRRSFLQQEDADYWKCNVFYAVVLMECGTGCKRRATRWERNDCCQIPAYLCGSAACSQAFSHPSPLQETHAHTPPYPDPTHTVYTHTAYTLADNENSRDGILVIYSGFARVGTRVYRFMRCAAVAAVVGVAVGVAVTLHRKE